MVRLCWNIFLKKKKNIYFSDLYVGTGYPCAAQDKVICSSTPIRFLLCRSTSNFGGVIPSGSVRLQLGIESIKFIRIFKVILKYLLRYIYEVKKIEKLQNEIHSGKFRGARNLSRHNSVLEN